MITPELVGYIRGEFAKGKTREEIRKVLVADSGWSEADLSEAFRIVIPMQGFAQSSFSAKSKSFWQNLAFIIIGLLCVVFWWFYRPQIIIFWSSSVNKLEELSINSWNYPINNLRKFSIPSFSLPSFNFDKMFSTDKAQIAQNNIVIPTKNIGIKDCGIGTAPDPKNSQTYENNTVLSCLGNSALRCEDAKAVLKDALFPTIFQIARENIRGQNICNFRLSYGEDSTLVDITGRKLALQYISCPISIVKALDESNSTSPIFKAPDVNNLSKYASQIYFYGTLGLFLENNIDQNKIKSLGCSGDYILSVVASYQKMQGKI